MGQYNPAIYEQSLNIVAYSANIFMSVGRQVTTASLPRSRLRKFKRHKYMVYNHNDPKSLPELIKTFTIMKLLVHMPNHLRKILGVLKVALYYVVQDEPTSPVPLPPLQPKIIWSLEKSIMMGDLVDYTTHTGPSYEAENEK